MTKSSRRRANAGLPAAQTQASAQNNHRQGHVLAEWKGPLPPPSVLAGYNDIVADGAARVFRQFEVEGDHRRSIDKRIIDADIPIEYRFSDYCRGICLCGSRRLSLRSRRRGLRDGRRHRRRYHRCGGQRVPLAIESGRIGLQRAHGDTGRADANRSTASGDLSPSGHRPAARGLLPGGMRRAGPHG